MGNNLWIALALVLMIEGLGPLLFPNRWQAYIRQLASQPANQLRRIGGTMVIIGLLCLYFIL